ncbi:MAG: DUF3859 domain-containing protein [Pseudomonadota bacterium]
MTARPILTFSALGIAWGAVVFAEIRTDETDFVSPLLGAFRAGVFCAPETVGRRAAPDTVSGETNIIDQTPPFASYGRVVPAVLGIGFGAEAGIMGDIGTDGVLMTVTHPPFDGLGATTQSFVTYIGPETDPSITFYQFDHPYELALGDWTMRASQAGVTLYEVTYTVVPPEALPELAGICGYQDLLS